MLILDTNVISEAMRLRPDENVIAWVDAQPSDSTWITAISVFEVQAGIARLPEGKRKKKLAASFEALITEDFDDRVLAFDKNAAMVAGQMAADLHSQGFNVEIRDLEIAGIVAVHRATFATRNVKDFDKTGITIINPWSAT